MMADSFCLSGHEITEPFLYKGSGLDGIYLLSGYELFEHDGETHVSITNVRGLHEAIGRFLVTTRKALAPKEIRFLRKTMGKTQAELAKQLSSTSQSVARWEKGETEIPGASEKLLRAIFLASLLAAEELKALQDLLINDLGELDDGDQSEPERAQFELFERWTERPADAA